MDAKHDDRVECRQSTGLPLISQWRVMLSASRIALFGAAICSAYSRLQKQVEDVRFFTQIEALYIEVDFNVVSVLALCYRRM